jgi:hypothetical protein
LAKRRCRHGTGIRQTTEVECGLKEWTPTKRHHNTAQKQPHCTRAAAHASQRGGHHEPNVILAYGPSSHIVLVSPAPIMVVELSVDGCVDVLSHFDQSQVGRQGLMSCVCEHHDAHALTRVYCSVHRKITASSPQPRVLRAATAAQRSLQRQGVLIRYSTWYR